MAHQKNLKGIFIRGLIISSAAASLGGFVLATGGLKAHALGSALGSALGTHALGSAPGSALGSSDVAASAPKPPIVRIAADGPGSFADLVDKVKPAVVSITTKIRAPADESPSDQSFDAPGQNTPDDSAPGRQDTPGQGLPMPGAPHENQGARELTAVGSGFFISADGYAVTAGHVVQDRDTVQVRTDDEKTYTAKVVGNDRISDLALIKVDGRSDFKYVQLAEQAPRVGDWVLAIGNAFGLGGTVTAGIVSAHEREIATSSSEDLIQIDAPINRGDSGGPSFDTNGRVIGVNTMIFSPSGGSVGIAFAVPAETARTVIPQLKNKGSVTRGWMGVKIQSVTPDIAQGLGINQTKGAIVASVDNNGPAARAGLTSGDVITAVGGEPVKDAHAVTKKIQGMAPASSARLEVLRQGKKQRVDVTLAQFPNPPGAARSRR